MKQELQQALYLSSAVRKAMPQTIRPGGFFLTRRLTELLDVSGKIVIDAGCGTGASLSFLKKKGAGQLIGVEPETVLLKKTTKEIYGICGKMETLPLKSDCANLLLAECAWNLSERQKSLKEFCRVLKKDGQLFLVDIFSRSGKSADWPVSCCFSAASSLENISQQVEDAGFTLQVLEDHTALLKKTAAEFVFFYGSLEKFWQQVTGNRELAQQACLAGRRILPGLFLLLAGKK